MSLLTSLAATATNFQHAAESCNAKAYGQKRSAGQGTGSVSDAQSLSGPMSKCLFDKQKFDRKIVPWLKVETVRNLNTSGNHPPKNC